MKTEELMKDIKFLLVFVCLMLGVITGCQICLMLEASKPPRAEAKSEAIQKVDLRKIGGNSVFLYDLVKKPY